MPNRKTKSKPKRRTASTLPVLNKILLSLEQQQNSQVPERPDVQLRSKPKRDRVYAFTQAYIGPTITSSTTIETDGAITFTLTSLPNATNLANVFDKYRIRQAKVTFNPLATEGVITSGVTAGPIYTVLDYDDANATTIASLVSYDNLKTCSVGSFFERTLTPRAALAAYSGVFTSFAQASPTQWLDVGSPSIVYYGLKYGLPVGLVPSGTVLWTTIITIEIEFGHPR